VNISDKEKSELQSLVGELEARSSLELVVAVARQSGSYADLELVIPLLCSWLASAFLVFAPFDFSEWVLIPALGLAFLLGLGVARLPAIRRLLPRRRARSQVEDAARAVFVREHVGATRERTGTLVYLSLRESDLEIVPDYGVQAALPDACWNGVLAAVRKAPLQTRIAVLLQELRALEPVLQEKLPRRAGDQDELDNAPRILS
jgi:uncharacterized membrane protein